MVNKTLSEKSGIVLSLAVWYYSLLLQVETGFDKTSRMKGDLHVRFCGRLRGETPLCLPGMLKQISSRMNSCKLLLHPDKTHIVNLRGRALKKYPKGFDFLGFTIRPATYKFKDRLIAIPGIFVSQKSKKTILQKLRDLNIHKWRMSVKQVAQKINPVIRGIISYFHKFRRNDLRRVWQQLNARLLKWVKWEKDLRKKRAIGYLRNKFKEQPDLFLHWQLVHP